MSWKGRATAIITAAVLTVLGAGTAAAQWPTTCVELNDIVEAHLGNSGNVGIYQRTFGDDAEQACQNDHRDDVRSVFAWAIGTTEAAPAPAPIPETAPPANQQPDYAQVYKVALARGASESLAANIAASVIERQAVDAFLRGEDDVVQYGSLDCSWRSAACPLAPERPATLEFAGTGEGDSFFRQAQPGLYRATIKYFSNTGFRSRPTNFAVYICDSGSGYNCDLVVNEIAASGEKSVFYRVHSGAEQVYVSVKYAAPHATWTVVLTPVGS